MAQPAPPLIPGSSINQLYSSSRRGPRLVWGGSSAGSEPRSHGVASAHGVARQSRPRVVRVPDWYWAVGYDGRDLVQSRSFDLQWSVPRRPPTTGWYARRWLASAAPWVRRRGQRRRPGRSSCASWYSTSLIRRRARRAVLLGCRASG